MFAGLSDNSQNQSQHAMSSIIGTEHDIPITSYYYCSDKYDIIVIALFIGGNRSSIMCDKHGSSYYY